MIAAAVGALAGAAAGAIVSLLVGLSIALRVRRLEDRSNGMLAELSDVWRELGALYRGAGGRGPAELHKDAPANGAGDDA